MSVIIRGMTMPTCCDDCDLNYDCFRCILPIKDNRLKADSNTRRMPNCPLIELPPHGRLIDGDVAEVIVYEQPSRPYEKDFVDGIRYAADWIANQPTVIEAEEVSE